MPQLNMKSIPKDIGVEELNMYVQNIPDQFVFRGWLVIVLEGIWMV